MNEKETRAFAHALLDWRQPVIVCKPRPDSDDVIPIVSWKRLTNSPEHVEECRRNLSKYEHGTDALALITGHGLDLIDVDTKAGGSIAPFGDFTNYGITATPSDGYHYLVPSTGLDRIQGLEVDGEVVGDYLGGKALAFLPGSHRPKYGDVGYGVKEAWDVEGCLTAKPEEHVVATLAAAGAKADEAEPPYIDDSPERDPALGLHDYAKGAIAKELARLDALPFPWAPGSHWDDTTFEVACTLLRFANSHWSGYTEEAALQDLLDHAPKDDRWGEKQHRQKWHSAHEAVGGGGRENPDKPASQDFTAVAPSVPGTPTAPLAVRLRERVDAEYDVFPGDDDGRIFVQSKAGGRAELLTGGFVIRASRGIGSQAATLGTAATEAAKVLSALAEARAPRPMALRVHQEPGRIVLDLAQPGNSRCVVVTRDGWAVEDVPPADVVFQSVGKPLPDPERGGSVEDLRRLLRWSEDDPRWPLVKGWLVCSLLATLPRPLLALLGSQGSAKSTTGRFIVGVLDPKPAGVLGGGFGKNRGDDETKALASFLVAWDNISRMSEDGADMISRLVTGDMIEKRRLYTDSELATIVYRRTGVVTGVSLPRGVKADTLDRLVLIGLKPVTDDQRLSEGDLGAEWAAAHPRVLAGVLDLAVCMLAGERANPDGLRMADYAEALWAVDPALYRAYADNVSGAREEMASNDPFISSLLRWLRAVQGDWEGTAEAARQAARGYQGADSTWWPGNSKAFMDKVTANAELLREVGVTVAERKSNGARLKRFTLVEAAGSQGPQDADGLL